MKSTNRIRLAIQKSGRLSDDSISLLNRCGIKFKAIKDVLFYHCENFPVDLLLVRDDDIPNLVNEGMCDYGIVGTNVLEENLYSFKSTGNSAITVLKNLNFGSCRLAIAVPENFDFKDSSDLNNKRIATSYPNLLSEFLRTNNIVAEIIILTGSVEIAPRLGISDIICDLVSTGATLEANNLREILSVFNSHAVLIKNANTLNVEKENVATLLESRLSGVIKAHDSKYIMLHAPKSKLDTIVSLLPGAEQPTLLTLRDNEEKIGLHAVCHENIFWETLEQLKANGASSILVLPIEKMMT